VLAAVGGPPLLGAAQVGVAAFACAIMSDSSMQCWGDDRYGQTATGVASNIPMPVLGPDRQPLLGLTSVTGHFAHGCLRTRRGELLCWGRGTDGEFGDGQREGRGFPAPLQVSCP